jgi:hypothetical protein
VCKVKHLKWSRFYELFPEIFLSLLRGSVAAFRDEKRIVERNVRRNRWCNDSEIACVCIHLCTYVCKCIWVYVFMHVCIYQYVYVRTCVFMYACTCIYMYVLVRIYICLLGMYVRMWDVDPCTCVCVYAQVSCKVRETATFQCNFATVRGHLWSAGGLLVPPFS